MAGFHKLAKDLLTTFGFPVTVENYTLGAFNIEEGEKSKVIDTTVEGLAVYIQLDSGILKESGYVYFEGDKKILLNTPLDFKIDIKTRITIQGEVYLPVNIAIVKDVLENAIYKLVIRSDKEV